MSLPFARTALSCALLTCAFNIQARDAVVLSDTVVSASGFEQKITDAPASISVISRDELTKKRYGNLAQALEDVEGVDVRQGTGKTGGLNISLRGLPSQYTLVLIDGRRQNAAGNVTPNGFGETSNSFMPPLAAIERIEVIRGPMSTLYGSDALGGVVNIITRKVPTQWGGSVTLDHTFQENRDYGSTSNASLYASGPLAEGLAGLAVRASGFDREESDLSYGSGIAASKRGPSPVEGQNTSVGTRLTLTPHENHDFALDLDRARQKYNNDNCQLGNLDGTGNLSDDTLGCLGVGPRAYGYRDELRFEREQIALTHSARLGFGTLDSSLMHNTTESIGRTIPGGVIGTPSLIPGKRIGVDRELKTTNKVFDTKLVAPVGDVHTLSVGGQWWNAQMTDGFATEDFEQTTWALFAEDEWRLRDDLALTLGARYDDHDAFGGNLSPRAYLVWNADANWTLKGGMSRGYKTPDLNDLHDGINGVGRQGAAVTIGNPDLEPEKSTSTELGVYFDNLEGFNANATLFHNRFKDKIAASDTQIQVIGRPNIPNGAYSQQVNIGKAQTQGLELAGSWRFAPAWTLKANYTYTESEQQSGADKGQPLTNTPHHLLHATLDWQTTDRLNVWLKGDYRGKSDRFTSRYANLANTNGSYSTSQSIYDNLGKDLKAYTLFHLGGSYRATSELTLSAAIYNLLDKDFLDGKAYGIYSTTGALQGQAYGTDYAHSFVSTTGTVEEGRRLWLSATYDF